MKNSEEYQLVITGLGVTSAIGQGKENFISSLLEGRQKFDVMKRPGRQLVATQDEPEGAPVTGFLGAEIASLSLPDLVPERVIRTASFTGQVVLATLEEAWREARLEEFDSRRIGLVVGGSNFQQRELMKTQDAYRQRTRFLRPTYGMSFMDSDVCGLCTETFGIRGFAYTLGGASASGQLAVMQAAQAVLSGQVDVCIAIGALMDLSYWECQGFRALGAMGSDRYAEQPEAACRPFDRDRDGFIYGESCGALVIEKPECVHRRGVVSRARLSGWATQVDANRNPDPSVEGETYVINEVLRKARLSPDEIHYVNSHGTGSIIGDEIELKSIIKCGLTDAYINATKSITGHGLTAAGAVEIIATVLQMNEGKLHPTNNLENPIDPDCNWIFTDVIDRPIENALTLSMGFGGVNSAVCLQSA